MCSLLAEAPAAVVPLSLFIWLNPELPEPIGCLNVTITGLPSSALLSFFQLSSFLLFSSSATSFTSILPKKLFFFSFRCGCVDSEAEQHVNYLLQRRSGVGNGGKG